MIRFEFKEGSGIAIGADCYRFVERIRDARCSPVFQHVLTGDPKKIPDEDIRKLVKDPLFKFLTPAEVTEAEDTGLAPKGPGIVFLDDIKSEWERNRVAKYEKYGVAWDQAGRPLLKDRLLRPIIARVAREQGDEDPPCARTLRRFIPRWVAHGCTLQGIISHKNYCGAKPKIAPDAKEILLDVIWDQYLTLTRPPVTACYESIKGKIAEENAKRLPGAPKLKAPSIQQVYREIEKLDKFTVMASREGYQAAMLKFGPRYVGVETEKHNQRWELDSTVVDLMVVDETGKAIGRPTITIVIDCYTRMIVGFHLGWEAESFVTFVAALGNAMQPKDDTLELYPEIKHDWPTLGVPEYLAVDNHSAYISADCKRACEAVGIDLQYTPVLKAWYRAIIERFFNTLTHKTFQLIPGTTFSDIFERNKETPPESIAVCTLEELRRVVTTWIVDEYHYTKHRGIKTVPAAKWDESTRLHATPPPPSPERMRTALAWVQERTPQHYGIEWEGAVFNSAEVANLRIAPGGDRRVRTAFNTSDISAIMVFDPGRETWISVPRVKPKLVPGEILTFAQYSLIKQLQKERADEFLGEDGYEAAKDFVMRYVDSKPKPKRGLPGDRGRARFQFVERPADPAKPTALDQKGSEKSVSDDIFGGPADLAVPAAEPVPVVQGADDAPAPDNTDQWPLVARAPVASPVPEPTTAAPAAPSDGADPAPTPAAMLQAAFIPADDDLDLNAEAARLGVKTHLE